LYDQFFLEKKMVIHQIPENGKVKLVDALLSKDIEKHFSSSVPTNFMEAASKTRPAVVYIEAASKESGWEGYSGAAAGSGVIIDPNGLIVTNNHVIEHNEDIVVTLNDRRTFKATTLGFDPTTDLALLKIEASDLPYLVFGNSDSLQVGEWVLAVGNPFKLQSTVTAGIVSAKGRDIDILDLDYGIESFIQTDAAINPGNSGGALSNTRGELVGISTAIITYSGRYEGYSFAIPANLARKVIGDLKEYGVVHRGLMGIQGTSVTAEHIRQLGLKDVSGVLITMAFARGGASEAGLRTGDVILKADDRVTSTMAELQEQLGTHRPGDTIQIKYFRDGALSLANVILRNRLNTTDLVNIRRDRILSNLGFELRDLINSEKRNLKLDGVKVISIYKGSKISKTKMEPGYIITRINEKRIKNTDQFIEELKTIKGRVFLEGFYEDHGGPWWYAFER
jgi:Do/DeqQ family serine protease